MHKKLYKLCLIAFVLAIIFGPGVRAIMLIPSEVPICRRGAILTSPCHGE